MSNYETKARAPMFIFLLGTLAFSLSSLPGHSGEADRYNSVSFSSEFAAEKTGVPCSLLSQLDSGDSASCIAKKQVDGLDDMISGLVKVQIVSQDIRDPKNLDGMTKEKMLAITVKTDDVETEPIYLPRDANYRQINEIAKKHFSRIADQRGKDALAAKEAAKKKKDKQAKRDKCLTDENDEKIEGKARMSCWIGRLDGMEDEKAADIFENNILPEVEALVKSDSPRDRQKGMALIAQLAEKHVGGDFVKETLGDLVHFDVIKEQLEKDKKDPALFMAPNNPARIALLQKMRWEQSVANSYFTKRGEAVKNEGWATDTNFDFAANLTANLEDFNAQIYQNYAAILEQHQNYLALNGGQNQDPRSGRAQVQTSLPGNGPVSPWPTPASPQFQQQFQRSNSAIPRVGAPVR